MLDKEIIGSIIINTFTIILSVIILYYLGWTFDETQEIKIDDWKRKYIIVFVWIMLIYNSLLVLKWLIITMRMRINVIDEFPQDFRKIIGMAALFILFTLLNNVLVCSFILKYIGSSFEEQKIEPDDWKRKYIIFFAWFSLVLCGISLYLNIFFKTSWQTATYYYNDSRDSKILRMFNNLNIRI